MVLATSLAAISAAFTAWAAFEEKNAAYETAPAVK
jgi:hypothetical protein